jgi:hypothetical protein
VGEKITTSLACPSARLKSALSVLIEVSEMTRPRAVAGWCAVDAPWDGRAAGIVQPTAARAVIAAAADHATMGLAARIHP